MIIQLDLTDCEIQQLRTVIDATPLVFGPMMITKVLKALPLEPQCRWPKCDCKAGCDPLEMAAGTIDPPLPSPIGAALANVLRGQLKLTAHTPAGVAMLRRFNQLLPHGGKGDL